MKQWSRKQMMKGLKRKIPEITLKKSEKFMGAKDGIWASWMTTKFYKGLPVFDKEADDYGDVPVSEVIKTKPLLANMLVKTLYVDGVYREIYNWLEDRGWYHVWAYSRDIVFFKYDLRGYGE